MKKTTNPILNTLGSYGLCVFLLAALFLVTFLGTIGSERIGMYPAIKMYFESYYFIETVGPISVPLPGAVSLMGLLGINLALGGFVRMRKNKRTLGILVVHVGIACLLVAGMVRMFTATESNVMLYEGSQTNCAVSDDFWEVAVIDLQGDIASNEWATPHTAFQGLTGDNACIVSEAGLPFDLHLQHFVPNASVTPSAPSLKSDFPVVDGYMVQEHKLNRDDSRDTPALFAKILPKGSPAGTDGPLAILYSMERAPFVIDWEGRPYSIALRRERYPLPFDLRMVKFTKSDHPGMSMAAGFSSDVVTVTDGVETPVHIKMNEPLRSGGLVFYQSSWGPQGGRPGAPVFSVLSVVQNPSDRWPEYSTWIITLGLAIVYVQRLMGYLSKQAKRRSNEKGVS